MRRMTRLRLTAMAAVVPLALAACGDDDGGGTGDGAGGGDPDIQLVSEGELTVCTDAPYEPFEFEEDGEWTGFDMEILREVGQRMDLELAVTVQPFDGIWLAPAAGTCDIVASAMTITPERQEAAAFSDPYFDADQSLMVRAEDEGEVATLDDLEGQTIGVQTGTTGADYAEENAPDDAEIRSYDEPASLFLALTSGEIDAILQDFPVNAYRATQGDEFAVTERFDTGESYGFAAAENNRALIEAVDSHLEDMREDGTYDEIFEEWFGEA
jgi:polar amino acid transport system substrate-binding protein